MRLNLIQVMIQRRYSSRLRLNDENAEAMLWGPQSCAQTVLRDQTCHIHMGDARASRPGTLALIVVSCTLDMAARSSCLKCCFTSTEIVGLLGTGVQDGHLDFHTAPELCPQQFSDRSLYVSCLRLLGKLRPVLTQSAANTTAAPFVVSRQGHCTS